MEWRVLHPAGAPCPSRGEVQKGKYPQRHPPGIRGRVEPRYQYGPGCLSDQLLGQWFAHVVGLGYLLPRGARARGAARAIFRHNFRRSVGDHESCQRAYALNDEAGCCCSAPGRAAVGRATRSPTPTRSGPASSTQVAGLLMYEGLVDAGLEIVRGGARRATTARGATRGTSSSAATTTRGRCPPGRFCWPCRGISTAPRRPVCASRQRSRANDSVRCLPPVRPGGGWRYQTRPRHSR